MTRDEAVTRIQDGLGFASRQSDKIILRLKEAQRELEKGKTLPQFLLQLDLLFVLTGTDAVNYPTGFLRIDDSVTPYRFDTDGRIVYLSVVRDLRDAQINFLGLTETSAPAVMVLRNNAIYFVNTLDANYTIIWSFYKKADVLDTNIENLWLLNAPEWLIGEAGWRMAMDARDKDAVVVFDNLRKTGRAAVFGEIVASEEASGPIVMGGNL